MDDVMRLTLDLARTYGSFDLAIACDVELDGVTALFGPSGAGKTTVLQAIAGFRPDAGTVEVDGTAWQGKGVSVPPHKRPVGIVFQDARLFEHLSVDGNLKYADKRAEPGSPLKFEEVVGALELEPLLERRPQTLSGGEKQRVAIGRALLTRPKLMLMDEPLAALDRGRKAAILPMIGDLPKRFGVPVVFISHQVEEISQITDNLIAIHDGRILGHGPTATMLQSLDASVTGYFEAGALVEGKVVKRDDDFVMTAIGIGDDLLWMPGAGLDVGDTVRVRLRSRDVSLSKALVSDVTIRNQLPATIVSIEEEQGAYAEVRLDCSGQTVLARITRMAASDLGLAPGQKVYALIKSVAFDRRLG